jgi:lysophospholipase L1-like esterase
MPTTTDDNRTRSPERVGVWRQHGPDGWRRDPACRDEWPRWADVDRLPAERPGTFRVLWVGESLARGFLFDPEGPPAAWLETTLRAAAPRPVQVIDLGSNGMTARRLGDLIPRLSGLRPDAIVLVAGNNWHGANDLDASAAQEAHAVFRAEGRAGVRRWCCETYLPALASRLLARLAEAARAAGGVPVVVVVPGFNLLDWRATPSQQFPLLAGDAAARWHHLRAAADNASQEETARALLALDRGDAPYTHYLLAEVALQHSRVEEARQALEEARDATCSPFLPFLPRCPRALQSALAREAARHGFAVVDLPAIFAARSAGGIPGRDLFLDYCHLSAEGNRLLVEHVARQLGQRLFGAGETLPPSALPPRRVQSLAHFLAAVHNARYVQPLPILIHHCRRALELDAEAVELLRWYAANAASAAPLWMSREAPAFFRSPLLRRHLLAPSPNHPPPFPDVYLGEAVRAVLGDVPACRTWGNTVDLLSARCCQRAADEEVPESPGNVRAFFRARAPESQFFWHRAAPAESDLVLTYRCPAPAADSSVGVVINGTEVASLPATLSWQTRRVRVPARAVRPGLNTAALHWPAPGEAPGQGEVADLRPVYGDLFAFRTSDRSLTRP